MKSGNTDKHRGTILLKPEENEQIFQLIGNRCQCLAAGVIQLYLTDAPLHKDWIKKNTGIITLIRDNPRRSFFLRLYCLQKKIMLWEHEIYNSMDYKAPMSYFHTFEAEDCMAAFNFASETEAITLRNILLGKLNAKRQRRQERKAKEMQGSSTLPWKNQSSISPFTVTSGSSGNLSNGVPAATVGVNRSASSSSMYKTKKKKSELDLKRKLTKDDISLPSNFRHVAHLGWDVNSKGLELDSVDSELQQFFNNAGVSEYELQDKGTRKFIYDFIERNGGMSAVQEDIRPLANTKNSNQPPVLPQRQEYPPPVPARTIPHQTRTAPPLPPNRFNTSALPSVASSLPPSASLNTSPNVVSSSHRTLPSRPPPPTITSAPALPPPPPPPPLPALSKISMNIPTPPPPPPLPDLSSTNNTTMNTNVTNNNNEELITDLRPMLMESIRSGTTLKKVDKAEIKPALVEDSRGELLRQIREGIELKPVRNEAKPNIVPAPRGGLADALSRALAERSRAIHSESEETTSDTSDDDEWDD
ncbi:neural Wiskott-Aldrich syndrome protein [Solenopsis invicta]|uniref:neural Wiskott-Aldrich syndrome protein n=1 Tax=Solenopsis invicta TaxID=13686 RepID=UPI000595BA09|nr:neural Wiskott-Aldrich syndrome protein [Solenopsis invicta]XP_039303455.1 neural Wiskott-Aldrich syndrome protein [Solenopsis invicta]